MSSNEIPSSLSPALREFFNSINSNCLPRIEQATVPILGVQNDRICHDRTGLLYQIGGHHFVLTASHKLRQIVQSEIPLYLSLNKSGADPVPLAQARFHSTEEDGRDLAAIWLPSDVAQEVARHKDFLFHNQINFHAGHRLTPYLFFGYPMSWSGQVVAECDVRSRAMAFATRECDGQPYASEVFNPAVHMAFIFAPDAIDLVNGTSAILPNLHGISGCGIWQVGDCSEHGLTARSATTVTLVGIQHTWSRGHGYIQATRIGFALDLIIANYPEIEPAMTIIYPTG